MPCTLPYGLITSASFFCFPPIVPLTRLDVVGSEPLDVLTDRIWRSTGPSGQNKVRAWSDLYFCPSRPFCGGLCIRPSRSSPETRTRISWFSFVCVRGKNICQFSWYSWTNSDHIYILQIRLRKLDKDNGNKEWNTGTEKWQDAKADRNIHGVG